MTGVCVCVFVWVTLHTSHLTPHTSLVTRHAPSYRRYDDSPRLVEKVCEDLMDGHVMRLLQVWRMRVLQLAGCRCCC